MNLKYVIKIQRNFKNFMNVRKNKCLFIIELLNSKEKIMNECLFEIVKISKIFPPQKNENKFIYGKLIEMSIMNCLSKIGLIYKNLDDQHNIGSEYMNDISFINLNFSIKAKLNKGGNIILINKKSDNIIHNIDINLILCVVNEGKMYIFPSNFIKNINTYIKNGNSTIEYKSSLFTLIDKKYKQFIYTFPKLNIIQKTYINNITPINIYKKLFTEYIC